MTLSNSQAIFISFFIFGLLNNILYVIILSAAIDLVGSATPKAVVLLADVIPSFTFKLVSPFFIHLFTYRFRLWSLVGLSTSGMLIISLTSSDSISLKIFGISLASLSSGLGEVSFLQLTHYYEEKSSIGGFSSGTGGAGLFGSFLFMLLTNIMGIPVWITLFMFSIIPFGFLATYNFLLPVSEHPVLDYEQIPQDIIEEEEIPFQDNNFDRKYMVNHISETIAQIKPLILPYMLPLTTVYISEYVINQGISPTLLFPLDELPHWLFSSYRDIYVVYGFLYQLGVFISRSSISFGVRIKNLYILSALQFVNVVITVNQSIYDLPFSKIWPLLVLILYEGLLGGFSYVNTFVSVSEQTSKSKREFSMGCVSMSDSLGIVVAGCINWWLEVRLCGLQVERGRDWCLTGGTH
ncbi:Protein BTN1 [Spathaspora sp. JA1]|nr:Protein BTN1 [Spathaspora sp. JA1]